MRIINIISTLSFCFLFHTNVFSQLDWTINDQYEVTGNTLMSQGSTTGSSTIISTQSISIEQNGFVEISNIGTMVGVKGSPDTPLVYQPNIDESLYVLFTDRCSTESYGFRFWKEQKINTYRVMLLGANGNQFNNFITLTTPLETAVFKLEKTGNILEFKINDIVYGDEIVINETNDVHRFP